MIDPDKKDEIDALKRRVKIENKNYAGIFCGDKDQVIVELSTAREWRASIADKFGIQVGEPETNPNDPPDLYVSFDGQKLGIELVQLVEQQHKERVSQGEDPSAGQLFRDMEWSKERFFSKLNDVINNKVKKYTKHNVRKIDAILIYTDESQLYPSQVCDWLSDIEIETSPMFASAFLLFSYEPGEGWPVIWLYGNFAGVSHLRHK